MLVYRSVWNDVNLTNSQFLDAATSWLRSRGRTIAPLENKRVSTESEHLDTWVVESTAGTLLRIRLSAPRPSSGEIWTTTATLIKGLNTTNVWVDVDVDLRDISQSRISAPGIVKNLLLSGGTPMIGSDLLDVQPSEIRDAQSVFKLFRWLRSDDRKLPLALFATHQTNHHLVTQRATRASETLAGLVAVFVIETTELVEQYNSIVIPELHITPGDVLLVMPGAHDSPDDPRLIFRIIEEDLSPNPRDAGQLLNRRLGFTSQWPDIPELWSNFSELLGPLPFEGIERSFQGSGNLDDEFKRLQSEVDTRIEELLNSNEMLKEQTQRVTELEDKLTQLLVENPNLFIPLPSNVRKRRTLTKVIEEARKTLDLVSIPQGAEQRIEDLDRNMNAESWAQQLATALAALQSFAESSSKAHANEDFYSWCRRTGFYSESKISMHEAETTTNNFDLMADRSFPIDTEVSETGRCIMKSHIKIQKTGNSHIPRVYFYDDTRGKTGKMHVGFIGPHYLVRHGNWN